MGTITMKTSKIDVCFELKGSGSATINWGDGKSSTYTISAVTTKCTYKYTGTAVRTITISESNLTYLDCKENQLTSLTLSGCVALSALYCQTNQLPSLSVSGLDRLTTLYCNGNLLTSLTLTGCTSLQILNCSTNKLLSLNLSACPSLATLYCYNNNLTTLNLSNFTKLTYLSCYTNNITSLNVSSCVLLSQIYCRNNYLSSLSVSGLSKLTYLSLTANNMTASALNSLFTSLPTIPSGTSAQIFFKENPGTTSCITKTATDKKWIIDYNDDERRQEINNYLRNTVFLESKIHEAIDDENRTNRIEGNYLIRYEKSSRQDSVNEFLMSCKKHELYPGMLLVVDNNLGTMTPTESGIARGKLTINIAEFADKREVSANADGRIEANVNNAIHQMANTWSAKGKTLTANFRDKTIQAMSLDELSIKASCSAKFSGIKIGANFEKNKTGYSTYFLTDYNQLFFTASAEIPNDLSKLFADHVTVDDIKRSFGTKPILFVQSVDYGRQLYMLEELSGTNSNMLAELNVSASAISLSANSTVKTSKSQMTYKSDYLVRGGSITNANLIFGDGINRNKDEKDLDFCIRQMNAVRANAKKFKTANTYVELKGTAVNEVNGVPLSYKASMLCGSNPGKPVTFWKSGEHLVKRVVPNVGLKVNVFNSNKDHNLHVSGWYRTFTIDGNKNIIPSSEIMFLNDVRVYNKQFMEPEKTLPKNIYSVRLHIRDRDDSKLKYDYTYMFPAANICAGRMRPGLGGAATVNWFFAGYDDEWYVGGEKK